MLMFKTVLMIALSELVEMMGDEAEDIEYELEHSVLATSAFPVLVDSNLYDADDMGYEARISRWMNENCGLNKTTIYVEVEA